MLALKYESKGRHKSEVLSLLIHKRIFLLWSRCSLIFHTCLFVFWLVNTAHLRVRG